MIKKISKNKKDKNLILPGSSQPQDLGSISYKDTETNETTQKHNLLIQQQQLLQKLFNLKKKFYQMNLQKNNMNLQQVF